MDIGSAMEFLGGVPLLQRLPSSSLKKIAELVIVKRYEEGQYIIRQGEVGEGIYFIWKGEAQVCGTVNEEEEGRPEFHLQQYDYFGDGFPASAQQADVIALSKLLCLVLPRDHCTLLRPKSIWNADKALDSCPLVESILHLESIEVNIFQGITLPDAPRFGKVFGGQFVGQALAAASKTVDCLKLVHSLHAYFLLIGDLDMPIIYNVQRIRDGKSFATRKVDAIQKGNIVFTLMASFQAPRAWFEKFRTTLLDLKFIQSQYDSSLFLQRTANGIVALLVYVDDIIITGSDIPLIENLQRSLNTAFHMKDLGELHYFLGLQVHSMSDGIFLHQHKYTQEILLLAGLESGNSVLTPLEINLKLCQNDGDLLPDPSIYRQLVGSLNYLTITRPDISFAVQQVSQFLQNPRQPHLAAVKRIIRYLKGTSGRGIFFPADCSLQLTGYSDADWAGCMDTRRSVTGWCMFLGNALISWKSKKQDRISKSSTESEYRAMSAACSEIVWLRGLLHELGFTQHHPTPLHADNTSAIQIASNPVFHERTKHIEVDCHYIREALDHNVLTLPHISTEHQTADVFTKALPRPRHQLMIDKLMLLDRPASI